MKRRDFINSVGVVAIGLMAGDFSMIAKGREKPMEIKAVKLYENGFMTQPFAMGLEDGEDKFDKSVKYRSTLQNFLIDTGEEVILVDTGMPIETPDMAADVNAPIYLGTRIDDYVTALSKLGYKKEQVTKILVTHKHPDHTGELRSFPHAKIFISRVEADAMELKGDNVIRVDFEDGPYENFDKCKKIADGVYYIFAPGHTTGTSIIIAESEGLHYLIHGDVTYTDEALYQNKLSVATEDKAAARDTLNKVRAFIESHRTIYLSTHTPLGYENLDAKKVVNLADMPAPIPPTMNYGEQKATGKYVCSVCGTVYDPAVSDPEHGIPAGTAFEDLPADWRCPVCKQPKEKFNKA